MLFNFPNTVSGSLTQVITIDTANESTILYDMTVGSEEDLQDTIAIKAAAFVNNLSEDEAARLIDSIRKTLPMNR